MDRNRWDRVIVQDRPEHFGGGVDVIDLEGGVRIEPNGFDNLQAELLVGFVSRVTVDENGDLLARFSRIKDQRLRRQHPDIIAVVRGGVLEGVSAVSVGRLVINLDRRRHRAGQRYREHQLRSLASAAFGHGSVRYRDERAAEVTATDRLEWVVSADVTARPFPDGGAVHPAGA